MLGYVIRPRTPRITSGIIRESPPITVPSSIAMNLSVKNEKGLSLIEITIVVVLVLIIAVASIPQISRTLELYNFDASVGLLSNRLMETRLTAIKHNRPAWLEINRASGNLRIFTTNDADQTIQKKLTMKVPRDISVDPASSSVVTFTSLGRNQANTDSLVIFRTGNNRYCKAVVISAVGNMSTTPC